MNKNEQVMQFADEVDKLADRFRDEYELTYSDVIGTFFMKSCLLCAEASNRRDEV